MMTFPTEWKVNPNSMVPNHQPDLGMTTEKSQVISGRAG